MTALGYYLQKPVHKIRDVAPRLIARDTRKLPAGRFVSICFDDFPKSAVTHAKPALDRRGWKATWYAAGSMMADDHPVHGRMFDGDDLSALKRDGHDIGCHTYTHLDCAPASDEDVRGELEKNRAFFRKHRLPRARSFAYPYGRVDLAAKRLLMRRMPAMRGVHPGIHDGTADRGLLRATGIEDHNGGIALALSQLAAMRGDASWLILFTHDISDTPSPWGCSKADFSYLLGAIERTGAKVVSVGAMIDRMNGTAPDLVRI